MGSLRVRTGLAGERAAVDFLRGRGLCVIEVDWRCRLGQIDIVCEEAGVLVVVEVKARRGVGFGLPQEAVDQRKQGKLRMLLQAYLVSSGRHHRRCRIDVVSVLLNAELRPARIDHIRNAVEA